jgi:hypothetical protein
VPVLRPGRPSGAGLAGFRCTGQAGQGRVDVPEPAADPGRGQPPGQGGPFPGQAQIRRQRPGEPELGMGGDDDPGPSVSGGRATEFRGGPAKDLLEQAEGVFKEQAALHT